MVLAHDDGCVYRCEDLYRGGGLCKFTVSTSWRLFIPGLAANVSSRLAFYLVLDHIPQCSFELIAFPFATLEATHARLQHPA